MCEGVRKAADSPSVFRTSRAVGLNTRDGLAARTFDLCKQAVGTPSGLAKEQLGARAQFRSARITRTFPRARA